MTIYVSGRVYKTITDVMLQQCKYDHQKCERGLFLVAKWLEKIIFIMQTHLTRTLKHKYVPSSSMYTVNILLRTVNIEDNEITTQTSITISHQICFNHRKYF